MAVGIVCEFNPFHNGHKYILSRAAQLTGEPVVCSMSGDFVQRGEYACADKKIRAGWALENGADIVIENPFPFCCATAERFAFGAVSLLLRSSLCDKIAFGIESGDCNADFDGRNFYRTAEILLDAKNSAEIARRVRADKRMGYAQIRSEYISEKYGNNAAALISSPNGILGVEYAKAALILTPAGRNLPELLPITRVGAGHDSGTICGENADVCSEKVGLLFASASYLRNSASSKDIESCCPQTAAEYLSKNKFRRIDEQKLYAALLQALLFSDESELKRIAEIPSEYVYKMKKAAMKCQSYTDFMLSLKARHMTDAKLRRMVLYLLTRTEKKDLSDKNLPDSAMLLGSTSAGAALLKSRKADKTGAAEKGICNKYEKNVPADEFKILSRISDIKKLPEDKARRYQNQLAAERLFAGLCM